MRDERAGREDERELDDVPSDTPAREPMESSAEDEEELNPDFQPDRMDLRAQDDMRTTGDAGRPDPRHRRLSDIDPMGGGHVRQDDSVRDQGSAREASAMRRAETAETDAVATAPVAGAERTEMELWPDMGDLRQRFDTIQAEFIDDPRSAVRKADRLINDVVDRITRSMRDRVNSMHRDAGRNADTEQLRLTMQGYRDLVVWMETHRAA